MWCGASTASGIACRWMCAKRVGPQAEACADNCPRTSAEVIAEGAWVRMTPSVRWFGSRALRRLEMLTCNAFHGWPVPARPTRCRPRRRRSPPHAHGGRAPRDHALLGRADPHVLAVKARRNGPEHAEHGARPARGD